MIPKLVGDVWEREADGEGRGPRLRAYSPSVYQSPPAPTDLSPQADQQARRQRGSRTLEALAACLLCRETLSKTPNGDSVFAGGSGCPQF